MDRIQDWGQWNDHARTVGVITYHHTSVQTSLWGWVHTTMHPHRPHMGWECTVMHPYRPHIEDVSTHYHASRQILLCGDFSPLCIIAPYCEGMCTIRHPQRLLNIPPKWTLEWTRRWLTAVHQCVGRSCPQRMGRGCAGEEEGAWRIYPFAYAYSDPKAVLKINSTESENLWASCLPQGLGPQEKFCAGPSRLPHIAHCQSFTDQR